MKYGKIYLLENENALLFILEVTQIMECRKDHHEEGSVDHCVVTK